MSNGIVYIGAPEADAKDFVRLARADFPEIRLHASNDRSDVLPFLADAEAIIGHHFQFTDDLLRQAPKLRWIQSLTTGTDAILKLDNLRPDVRVTSTRGMHGPQMSELVFLTMLGLGRDFPRMLRNQMARRWERWPQPLLTHKTVVIVGIGAIAEVLARRCKAFGMRVCGVSKSDRVPEGFDLVMPRSELPRAAAMADFLVLIVPLSAETEMLIDASIIAALKPSAFLINVARGGVLDEVALMSALNEGRLAGAALDVFRRVPLPPDDPLWQQERLILTPMVGGMSDIYLEQAYPIVRQNLECFLTGRPGSMINLVAR